MNENGENVASSSSQKENNSTSSVTAPQQKEDGNDTTTKQKEAKKTKRPQRISITRPRATEEAPEKTVSPVVEVLSENKSPLTEESLQAFWGDLKENFNGALNQKILLNDREIRLDGENKLVIRIPNMFYEKSLNELNLSTLLRNQFGSDLTLSYELIPQEEQQVKRTPVEIFQRMLQEKPELNTLRERLNLELE